MLRNESKLSEQLRSQHCCGIVVVASKDIRMPITVKPLVATLWKYFYFEMMNATIPRHKQTTGLRYCGVRDGYVGRKWL